MAALAALAAVPAAQADGVAVMRPYRYAVAPTHNRYEDVCALVMALAPQCDEILIIDNASDPPIELPPRIGDTAITTLYDGEQPPNLSRLWNVGFGWCERNSRTLELDAWDVAVFNDDAIVPAGWYDTVAEALRRPVFAGQPQAVAHTHTYGDSSRTWRFSGPGAPMDLMERMCPWAYVVRGELGLRSDERLRWWWFDTDFEIRARAAGGVLAVPGPQVTNSKANSTTVGMLAEQAGRDRETFKQIHGFLPW